MELEIEANGTFDPGHGAVEMVERKGAGHPDTLCDAVAERVSCALSRHYLEHFETILHHNVDKVLLVGGSSTPRFGGGEVTAPMELFVAGRATERVGRDRVPVDSIAEHACREALSDHLRDVDPTRDVRIHSYIRPGAIDLVDVFQRRNGGPWLANDTSVGMGFAPYTALETTVREADAHLRDPETRKIHPALGDDVKIMGVRCRGHVALTAATAFVDRHASDLATYIQEREAVRTSIAEVARARYGDVSVDLNAADDLERGSVYLTVRGTSAESGDDGEAGRGNRAGGLITPYRPTSMEAVAGKNPVSHVGKIYNLVAGELSAALAREIPEVTSAQCGLVSRIGHPVDDPPLLHLQLGSPEAQSIDAARRRIEQLVGDHLAATAQLWKRVLAGEVGIY